MPLTHTFARFFKTESAGGLVLLACTLVSLSLANSAWGPAWLGLWQFKLAGLSLEHWVNDALMAVFFLLVGLELERELYVGELSDWRKALLPIVAAVGGIAVPAGIHYALNADTATQAGAGIPMATDIAFALGVLAMLGKGVPSSLKVFLTVLATLNWRWRVMALWPYLLGGVLAWFFMLKSGVHATVAGVLLAFMIPFSSRAEDEASPSHRLEHALHKPVAFGILPLFALANTGVLLGSGWYQELLSPNTLGIMAGLVAGKPLGIALFCVAAVMLGWCALPDGVGWRHVIGAGMLGGIGFTMSIFITNLAFANSSEMINASKAAILVGSALAGVLGAGWLWVASRQRSVKKP
jgi:Na+:H+ antiporter, NhaA family